MPPNKSDENDPAEIRNPKLTIERRLKNAEGGDEAPSKTTNYSKKFSKPFTPEERKKQNSALQDALRKHEKAEE